MGEVNFLSHTVCFTYDYFLSVIFFNPIKPKPYFMYHQL